MSKTPTQPHHRKRQHGQYFTVGNAFTSVAFKEWFSRATRDNKAQILEPFSGAGHIPSHINHEFGYHDWACFDISPPPLSSLTDFDFSPKQKDVLVDFPEGFSVAITNPPYLAKNSAHRRGLVFPDTTYPDLYLLCVETMLSNVPWVGAIIPESFVSQGLFRNRLEKIISLPARLFEDTDCPVCLALFSPDESGEDFEVWFQDSFLDTFLSLSRQLPEPSDKKPWRFNDVSGNISLLGCDSTSGPDIRFGPASLVSPSEIKVSSRAKTLICNPTQHKSSEIIDNANHLLFSWRKSTKDVLMTPFKGARKDGMWRRRLDFRRARWLLDLAVMEIEHGRHR